MRQIKFRAYDTVVNRNEGNRVFEVAALLFENGAVRSAREHGGLLIPAEELVLMQFTGLHDKNGKEIYEGDIVRLEQWQPQVYEVLFDRGGFCFRNQPDANFYHDAKYLEECEVIGNVYENADLLEQV